MNKCPLTQEKLDDISQDIYTIGEVYLNDEEDNARENFISSLYDYIENTVADLKKNDIEIIDENIDKIVEAIMEGIASNEIEEDDILDRDNFKSKILLSKQGLIRNKTNDSISTETILKDIEESQDIKERSSKFLDLSYGLAKEVQRQAQLEINVNLFDALFINRGSIEGRLGTVTDSVILNRNIRQLQEQLLVKICNYLKSKQDLTQSEKDLINNAKIYENGKNTGKLNQIYKILAKYTNQNRQSSERLRWLYNQSKSGNQATKLELDAYNAYVFLKHFDSYLQLTLGKAISINPSEFGKKSGKDFYKISDSTADLATTWRNDEDISLEDEIDNITKLAINTIRIYKYGTSEPTNRYMTFQYFQNILGKIKELGSIDISTQSIVFGKDFYENIFSPYYNIWNSFSTKTKNLIKDRSLASVINIIRQNPIQNLSVIFEILSNQNFRNTFKDISQIFNKYFISEELDHIYSVHKQIFDVSSKTSLRGLTNFKDNLNYYQYIAQASDAIFKNQFIQYFADENGHIKCRVLTDTEISNQSRKFKNDIISGNQNKSVNFTDFKKVYNPNFKNNIVTFTIPGTPIQVAVTPKTEFVTFTINNEAISNYEELIDNPNIKVFLDSVLKLGIRNNSDFIPTYFENCINPNVGVNQLLNFASNVVARQYISLNVIDKIKVNKDEKGKDDTSVRDSTIESIFGDIIKYSQSISQIQLISNTNISKFFIRNIAKTRFMLNGMVTSTQVKDSQQASQNLQSLSRLLGSYGSHIELIEKLPDSVTKNLKFINTPGLFKGHYTTSEYYSSKLKKSKKATKFTVAEMFYSNFVTNYITGFTDSEAQKYDHIHGNLVSFLASVNSDKNTIGQLYIDMNIPIDYNGQKIPVKNLTTDQIKDLIANDFGVMYSGILDSINQDYNRIFDFINNELNIPFQYIDNGYYIDEDYINNFEILNREFVNNPQLRQYGNNPIQIIKKIVEIHNQFNRFNPIELVDQIHFSGKKNLESNQTLISQIARFNPEYFIEYIGDGSNNLLEGKNYPNFNQFFQQKEGEILNDLLKSKFEINLLNGFNKKDKSVPLENTYLSKTYPDWTNRTSGKVILGKVTLRTRDGQPKTFNIISNVDLKKIAIETGLLESNIIKYAVANGTLQIHPELSKYNYLDYFFTQSWMNTTVGSFIAHPDKSKSQNVIEQEASRYQAQHKRNVSMTAQMHPFILNSLNGITEEYNVAVIDDIKDFQSTLAESGIEIKPYDGATFVNPFTVYLENNSLGGSRAGFDKKQFVHFKSHRTGNGGIIKTAGFAINNDRLRRSPEMWHMMRKMTDITWLSDPNNPQLNPYATINILQNTLQNQPIIFGDIYFERKGRYYKVNSMQSLGNNEYSRIIQEVDKNGNLIGKEISEEFRNENAINSNFKLWKFFGGAHSMVMTERGLKYSESSIENVVKVMNNVGTLRYKPDGTQYTLNEVETQTEFFQPLKQVDIHYLATSGAVKQGAANINSANKYNNKDPLDFQRIKMYQAGIQLDKEHHANNAELSLPTQITSAAAALGYTFDQSHALYEGLANATELGIGELIEAVNNVHKNKIEVNKNALTEKVLELIVKNLAKGNTSNSFAAIIAQSIKEAVSKDSELSYMKAYLPLSDNTVFSKMISTVNSYITSKGIKLKIDGLLAVLTPSHNLFKIFGNKTYDQYKDPNIELELEQQKLDTNPAVSINQTSEFRDQAIIDFETEYDQLVGSLTESAERNIEKNIALQARTVEQKNNITKNWEPAQSLHEYLLRTLPSYYRKVLWNDEGTKRGLKSQLYGRTVHGGDLTSLLWMTSKDGMSFDEMIHQIWENLDSNLAQNLENITDQDIRNEVLDVLLSTPTSQLMYETAIELEYSKPTEESIQAASELNSLEQGFEYYRDDWFQNKHGVNYNQYVTQNSNNTIEGLNQCSANISLERTYKVVYNESVNNPAYDSEESLKVYLKSLPEFKQRGDESDVDYEERMQLETFKEMERYNQDNRARIEYVFMSLDNYRKLRDDIRSGKVLRVTEYIKSGRNLGAYNVRATTKDGSRTFQLWDLDSIRNVHELLKLKEEAKGEANRIIKEQNIQTPFDQGRIKHQTLQNKLKEWYLNRFGFEGTIDYDSFLKEQRIRVQQELENLSNSVEDKVEQFDKLVQSEANITTISNWVAMNLSQLKYNQIMSSQLNIESKINEVRKVLIENQKVRVDGQLYDVDKASLDIPAYELIMPKTFINEFFNGEEFIDLDTVKQDEDYFIKQALRLKAPKLTNSNQYDVELKRGDGNHFYLIDSKHLPSTLNPIQDELMLDTIEGKTYRTDSEGKIMYELLPGTSIYTDSNGNEVFVIRDVQDENGNTITSVETINKYVEQLKYNNFNLSQNLINYQDYLFDLITVLEENKKVGDLILKQVEGEDSILCKSEKIQELAKKYKDSKFVTPESILEIFNIWNQVNESNYKDILKEDNPIVKAGRIKHSSFLKSLDIVAARIPSQSLQSFMPMKVVAYDNPNRNAAYVSTLQILLQGSDFDIDAVSLVTFDINSNGNLDLWSPYANLNNINNLEASMKLPFPTGKDVIMVATDEADNVVEILKNFKHILNIIRNKNGEIKVSLKNINNPINIESLKELLNITTLSELSVPKGIVDFHNKIQNPIIIQLENGQTIRDRILPIDIIHPNDVKDIINGLADIINKHNTYLKNTDKYLLDHIIKNYTISQLYNVIKDPANLVQAQTSVDATTGAFKKIANESAVNEDIKTRTAGNNVNKIEGISDNQVGKDCISICAVGIKGYFALTQYANEVLNNGTSEDQARLIGKAGNFTTLLSNIRAKNVSTISNQEVLNLLVSVKNMDDQVLALSALLSLSTDNAKELALAKLNAGINMISTYIYGITIGKDFKEISKLLMSQTGEILRDIVDENNMQDIPGYNKLRNAFDYFEKGPFKYLSKFDSYYDYIDNLYDPSNSYGTTQQTPLERLESFLYPTKDKNYNWDKSFLLNWLERKVRTNTSLVQVLSELDTLRNNSFPSSNIDRVRYNQLIDFAQEYATQYYTINPNTLKEIKFLTEGAYEMEILGKIVGLNQGIPTDLSGFVNKCKYIENALEKLLDIDDKKVMKQLKSDLSDGKITYDQYKEQIKNITGYYEIDLLKFAFDSNYRKQCITDYERVKYSFNILDVIDKLPHVLKYVQALAVADACAGCSYKYRSIKNNYKALSIIHGGIDQDIVKGLNNYIGDQIIQDWMLSENLNIIIPEGNKVFNRFGELSEKETKVETEIKLGSEYANASFRIWVENKVIPDLKKQFPNNEFIQNLGNDTRNNTLSGNGSVIYTLPINMLPRTDQERAIFNIYQDSFNDLSQYPYKYESISLDNNGNKVIKNNEIDILNIFTLYSMIAHNWKLGEGSLVSILEGFQDKGLIKKLHDYTAKLDYSGRQLELNSIELSNLVPYLASKKGIYSSFNKHTWNYNKETEKFELWSKGEKNYSKNVQYNFANPDYFQGTNVRNERKLFKHNIRIKLNDKLENFELNIQWSQGNGNDEVTIVGKNFLSKQYVLKDIKNIPVKSQYSGIYRLTQPDVDKIKKLIQQELDNKNKPETCDAPF